MVHFLGGKSVKHVGEKVQLCRGNVSKLWGGNVLRVNDTQPLENIQISFQRPTEVNILVDIVVGEGGGEGGGGDIWKIL